MANQQPRAPPPVAVPAIVEQAVGQQPPVAQQAEPEAQVQARNDALPVPAAAAEALEVFILVTCYFRVWFGYSRGL